MAQSVIVKNKEIRVKNPQMVVEDENRAELIEFTITNAYSIEDVEGMIFYVQFRNKLGEVGMDTLVNAYPSEIVHNDMLVLDWLPSASFTKERGKVEIQIVGFTETLVQTSDSTYQSGKVYFSDDAGTFLPVYPATSTHSPKVGDTITGTVYENQVTGNDHRWSTEKCQLILPDNICDNGTPVYTEAQVKSLITQIGEQIGISTTNALKSEGFATGKQNGTDVDSSSPYYHNNAEYFKEKAEEAKTSASESATDASAYKTDAENARDKAEEWATKTNGKIDNIDYSAKHYASEAGDYAEEADNARIVSVSETQSTSDGGTNVVTITYKDGTTFVFFVKNGNAGTPFTIYKTYSSIAEMNADFANVPEGRFVIISSSVSDPDNSKMFVRGSEEFTFVTDLSGAQGIQGPAGLAATITVGSVTSGATASVHNSGTSSAAVFDFVLPKGDKGDQGVQGEQGVPGPTPVISIGSVTYGDTPTVTIDTTDPAHPVMNFVLKTSEVGVVDNLNSSSSVDALSARMGNDLKNAIDANSKRITNLETKAGDEIPVTYPSAIYGTDGVPASVAPYGKVRELIMNSRVRNQQMPIVSSFSRYSNGVTFVSDGNGKYSISGLASANSETKVTDVLVFPKGHRFLIATTKPMSISTARIIIWVNNSISAGVYYGGQFESVSETAKLFTIDDSWDDETIWFNVQNGKNPSISDLQIIIRDLTQYFSSDPSVDVSTLTISDIQTNYPELLIPSDYDTGTRVDTTYSAVKSVGKNLFNEPAKFLANGFTFSGGYWSRTVLSGLFETGISYKPNTQYAFSYNGHCSVSNVNFRFFVNYTDGTSENTALIPSTTDALYTWVSASGKTISSIRTSFGNGGLVYLEYLQIEEGSSATSYSQYMTDTLTLPTPVTGKSAGSVHQIYYPETGEMTEPLREVDLGTLSWNILSSTNQTYVVLFNLAVAGTNSLCVKYLNIGIQDYTLQIDKTIQIRSDKIIIRDTAYTDAAKFKSAMSGVKLLYELATPNPNSQATDPMPDPFIKVEGGGTIRPVQSQTTQIDSAMSVDYLGV